MAFPRHAVPWSHSTKLPRYRQGPPPPGMHRAFPRRTLKRRRGQHDSRDAAIRRLDASGYLFIGRLWPARLPHCRRQPNGQPVLHRQHCGKRASPVAGQPAAARGEAQRWRHLRPKDPASRPSETVTNSIDPISTSLRNAGQGYGWWQWHSDLGHVTSYLPREKMAVPRGAPRLGPPVAVQDDNRRYPPHSLRTFRDVRPELTYCGVVLPRIVCLSPWSQKAGACHRCFIVSLQIISFLVFCPRLCARVPTLSDG
jgi:hypothetical protein